MHFEMTPLRKRAWLQSIRAATMLAGAVSLWVQNPLRAVLSPENAVPSAMGVAAAQAGAPKDAVAGSQTLALVTASVVWKPDTAALKALEEQCDKGIPSDYARCFTNGMGARGAPSEAVAFARELGESSGRGPGYVTDFTEGGTVAVAHVAFPARSAANDQPRQAWLLVNGSPGSVDVDDLSLLPGPSVEGDLILQEIRRSYPKAGIYGDERTAASPALMSRPDGGERFPVTYALRNGCQSCEEVGNAEVAFDFSADGKFQGATLLGMWMRKDMGTLVAVQSGRDFYLHLSSNHSAGFSWQLASPLNEKLLKFVSKDYSEPSGDLGQSGQLGQLGKTGVEKWTLHAMAPGRTIVRFQNVQAGETNPPPDRRFFFAVTVQ
jgi:predicted secreted protein